MNFSARLWPAVAACLLLSRSAGAQVLEGQITANDQFEYSYSSETQREIFENWLDVSYYIDGFRTGILLNSQAPSEEGDRLNAITHRFFEFSKSGFDVRVGHFYGLFGRGLVFSSYEDRFIRVDTVMDGILIGTRQGRFQGRVFSGTPRASELDIRGLDLEYDLGRSWSVGSSGLTYLADSTNREAVAAGRMQKFFAFGDLYFEGGWKQGYDFEETPDDEFQEGHAYYGALNLYTGWFSLALEGKDYERFAVLPREDGRVALNNPPSLTREHYYTLLSRNTHNLDADDEVGVQAELIWSGPADWTLLASGNRTENHEGELLFTEAYGHIEKEDLGSYRVRGACGYQDVTYESKGENLFIIGELNWDIGGASSLTVQFEHQHNKLGPRDQPLLGGILYPGAFDIQYYTLEFAQAPHWTIATMFETNNKTLPEQQTEPGEKEGPFPAATISYATSGGGNFTLWAGKRQAGQLCTGGVCKREPAFEGVEFYGVFRF